MTESTIPRRVDGAETWTQLGIAFREISHVHGNTDEAKLEGAVADACFMQAATGDAIESYRESLAALNHLGNPLPDVYTRLDPRTNMWAQLGMLRVLSACASEMSGDAEGSAESKKKATEDFARAGGGCTSAKLDAFLREGT
jgi:hypothetical protein